MEPTIDIKFIRGKTKTSNLVKKHLGKRYGRLVVIGQGKKVPAHKGQQRTLLRCQCDCGKIVDRNPHNLKIGNTRSCGCLASETIHKVRYKGCGDLSGCYWLVVKRNAKSRGLPVDITIDEAWNLFINQNKKCSLTNVELTMDPQFGIYKDTKTKADRQTASLDRIDSSKGYVEGNVRWIHRDINAMKMDLTDQEFLYWCDLIVNGYKE